MNQPKVVQAFTQFQQSKPIYDALSVIEKKLDGQSDNGSFVLSQKCRAVESSLRSMKHGGVGLEGAEKERFNEIKMKLVQLSTTFSNNVLDETKAFSETVEDPYLLQGVPASAKAMWANSHAMFLASQDQQKTEFDPQNGPWRITLDGLSYIAALAHITDRALREKVYMASIRRASEANEQKNNIPLIYEILQLKAEMANMLGFKNYAELSLASKMAPSVKSVAELSGLIAAKTLPAAEKELAEITAYARENGGVEFSEASIPKLELWGYSILERKIVRSEVRDYGRGDTALFRSSCFSGWCVLARRAHVWCKSKHCRWRSRSVASRRSVFQNF